MTHADTAVTWIGRLISAPTGQDWLRLNEIYRPLILYWLRRAGVPMADREDLAQDVLIVVVKRIVDFEHQHPGAFRGWLRIILENRLRQYFRQQDSAKCEFDLDELQENDSQLSQLIDREHNEHIARRLMQAVARDFSQDSWAAFQLTVLEGSTAREVAMRLQMSLNAVMKAKCRILKRLREELVDWVE